MPIRDNYPVQFVPVGLTDGVDQLGTFQGACQQLSNFIFDRTNRGSIVPRPGVVVETNFTAFLKPAVTGVGVISVMMSLGTKIYGMIAATGGTLAGFDVPFIYETANQTFITITGPTTGNLPTTQSTAGVWVPPTIDQCGNKVVVTHPGFATGANFFGWFDITTPAAPTWTAGNTTTNALPFRPIWVRTFTNRFYFGVTNSAVFSDAPSAWGAGQISISNTNFASALTIGDASDTTAGYFIPIKTITAGTLQGLTIFKSLTIWQVTGDIGTTNLAINQISSTEGCSAPRTIQALPQGVSYMGSNGMRFIDAGNNIGPLNLDVLAPFTNATNPSRICATYNNGIYRICLDTIFKGQTFTPDYWFDNQFNRWNGPHTFPFHVAVSLGPLFYLGSNSAPGMIYRSQPVQLSNSIYTDAGNGYNCQLLSASMVNQNPMSEKQVIESTIELSPNTTSGSYFIQALDDLNQSLASATITIANVLPLWGSVFWGAFNWAFSTLASQVFSIPWGNPIVFQKFLLSVSIVASANVSIKSVWLRFQDTGYMNQ